MPQDPYLPDGCKITDIPGNRPQDEMFDRWLDTQDSGELAEEFWDQNEDKLKKRVLEMIADRDLFEPDFERFIEKKWRNLEYE